MSAIETKNKINISYSFIDEVFDLEKASAYLLILQIGVDGLSIAVNERAKNKYIALECFSFNNLVNFSDLVNVWDSVVKTSQLFTNKYKAVTCSIVNGNASLIPNPLFEEGREKTYLKFNVPLDWNELVLVDNLKSIEAKNVFALPIELKVKLDSCFGNVVYCHFSSTLIESLVSQNKNQTIKKTYIHVHPSHFEIIVIEGKQLLFYNTFNYHSPEDFIYYLLFVCEQMQLNPENMEAVLLGEIETNSEIVSICKKYIRNVNFGERSGDADFGYQLQTLPKHFYFSLFNNYFSLIQ